MREYIDDDLAYSLLTRLYSNPEDYEARVALEYLTKFNNEFYRGVLKKGDPSALHNTPELYKDVNDRRNAQRRDVIGAANAGKSLAPDGEPYVPVQLVSLEFLK